MVAFPRITITLEQEEEMKKLIASVFATAMVLAVSSLAFADNYGTAGCGLGSVIFEDQPGAVQILAATTNGTSGNQTFGITTGTLNCGDKPVWAANDSEMQQFVAQNMDGLAMDIAAGGGETFDAFAELMDVPVDQRDEFAAELQQNFAQVFTSEQVVMAEVIDNAAVAVR